MRTRAIAGTRRVPPPLFAHLPLVSSFLALSVAAKIAMNLLTIRLRK